MAITVDSGQWTGESDAGSAVPVVWGEFADEAARDRAREELGAKLQAETSPAPTDRDRPLDQPDEDPEGADIRNQRQLHVGIAMAATAMGAAGLVIASGGTVLPAIAAATAAGAGTGLAGEAVAAGVTPDAAQARTPPSDGPLIGLRAPDAAMRQRAERVLRELGAQRILVQEG
ncbi:hypothetical protein [Falsiroseomonas selenitidurans]|uniref:SPOR domain-containing protein n=1 Tax=Falsiroseomonas selenitidurans TaxID=2716335 RepID=A0ABX1DXD4_9PROT|nr:hypothetical protein [Falsiroseomonas selenitidurans]NKC29446.1 hypothetical protein [Falsiroseomonas selenitidurans]